MSGREQQEQRERTAPFFFLFGDLRISYLLHEGGDLLASRRETQLERMQLLIVHPGL